MTQQLNINPQEIENFAQHSSEWWDKEGAFKTLHAINPTRLEFVLAHTSLKGKRVLDVGCGGGILSESLARKEAEVTGLDVEIGALAVARSHAAQQQLTIDYVNSPIENFSADPFDIVTCMEMLEHVPDPAQIIHHCARLLKPGGYLFVSTINRTLSAYLTVILAAEYLLKLLPRQTHSFQKFIKPSELMGMMRRENLKQVALKGIHYRPWAAASLVSDPSANYVLACRKE